MGELERAIQSKIRELSVQKKLQGKRIFLFGYNTYVEHINRFLYDEGYTIFGILDNDKKKQERKYCNIYVYAPENIEWGGSEYCGVDCVQIYGKYGRTSSSAFRRS